MIGETLRKVIDSIIIPKYPWIESYEISQMMQYDGNRYYSVTIIPTDEFYETHRGWAVHKHQIKLQEEIKSLFNMIGPAEDQFFDSLDIPHKYD